MAQRPPDVLPGELFCVTARAVASVAEHEEFLLQQHEIGALRLHDRGRFDGAAGPLRRWRMSWSRGGATVHAALAFAGNAGRLWFAASCELGWGWGSASPVVRVGFAPGSLLGPVDGLPVTGSVPAGPGFPLRELSAALASGDHAQPVLVHHLGPDGARWISAFRTATAGCAAVVLLDDEQAVRLAGELPERARIPGHGARLFLPGAGDRASGVGIPAADSDPEPRWREAVDAAFAAVREFGPGPEPHAPESWQALLTAPGGDERVATPAGEHWQGAADAGKPRLRRRISDAGDELRDLRELLAEREGALAEVEREIESCRRELVAATESRRRLTRGLLRLRAERDAARERLARTSLGTAQVRTRDAQRLARVRSEELQRCEEELSRLRRTAARLDATPSAESPPPPTGDPGRLSRIRLGPEVADEIRSLDGERAWRCRELLAALDEHAATRTRTAAEHLRAAGVSPLLLGTAETGNPVTFRVPPEIDPSGWAPFPHHAFLDHSGQNRFVLHYLDDTAGPTAAVHIGYVGPAPDDIAR